MQIQIISSSPQNANRSAIATYKAGQQAIQHVVKAGEKITVVVDGVHWTGNQMVGAKKIKIVKVDNNLVVATEDGVEKLVELLDFYGQENTLLTGDQWVWAEGSQLQALENGVGYLTTASAPTPAVGSALAGVAGAGVLGTVGFGVVASTAGVGINAGVEGTGPTASPTITVVAFAGTTGASGGWLNVGDTVTFTVTFSENVNVTGTPQLQLNIGGTLVPAAYVSGSGGTTLTFSYTIQASQTDMDGMSIEPNSLSLNGGSIQDGSGNVAVLTHTGVSASNPMDYRVDTTAPAVPVIDLVAGDDIINLAESTGAITGTAEALATVNLTVGTNVRTVTANSSGVWSYTLVAADITAMGQGAETLSATQTDVSGNTSSTGTRDISVDTSAPTTPSTAPANYADNVGTITSTTSTAATTDDTTPGLNIGTLPSGSTGAVLYVNGLPVAATYDPATGTLTPNTPLNSGAYSLSYTLIDAAGNQSGQSPVMNLTVNNTLPTTPVINSVTSDNIVNAGDQSAILTGTADAGTLVSLTLGTGNVRQVTANGSGVWSYMLQPADIAAMDQGAETLSAISMDVSGNTSVAGTRNITIDTVAPTLAVNTLAGDGTLDSWEYAALTAATPTPLTVSGSTTGVEDGQSVNIALNNQQYTTSVAGNAWSLALTTTDAQALNHGNTYTATASVQDVAGNVSNLGSANVLINIATPDIPTVRQLLTNDTTPVLSGHAEKTLDGGINFLKLEAATLDILRVIVNNVTYTLTIGGTSSPAGLTYNTTTGDWALDLTGTTALSDGVYEVQVAVTAGYDTKYDIGHNELTINTTPVGLTVSSITSDNTVNAAEAGGMVFIQGTASNMQAGRTVALTLVDGSTVNASVLANGTWSTSVSGSTFNADGPKTITLNATNAAGTSATTLIHNLTVDKLAPTLAITSDVSTLKAGQTAAITFIFSEDPSSSFAWDGTSGDVVVSGGSLSAISGTGLTRTATFTPTAGINSGSASITVASGAYTDAATNSGGAGTTPSITIDTLAPTLSNSSAPSTSLTTLAGTAGTSAGEAIVLTVTFDGNVNGLITGSDNTIFKVANAGVSATWDGTPGTNTRTLNYTIAAGQNGQATIDEAALKAALIAGIGDAAGNAFSYTANGGNIANIDSTALPVVDTTAPAVPSLVLARDTGTSNTDKLTNTGALMLTGAERGTWLTSTNTLSPTTNGGNGGVISAQTTDLVWQMWDANWTNNLTLPATSTDGVRVHFQTLATYSSSVVTSNTDLTSSLSLPTNSTADFVYSSAAGKWLYQGSVGYVGVEYNVDGAGYSSVYTAPTSQGAHTVLVRQSDAAGNTSDPYTFTFTIDNVAPTLSSTAPSTSLTTLAGTAGTSAGEAIVLTVTFDGNVNGLTTGSDSTIFKVANAGVSATWGGTPGTSTRTLTYTIAAGQNGQASIDEAALKAALIAGIGDAAGNAFSYTANSGNISAIDSSALPVIDTLAPTASATTASLANTQNASVQSSETGTAYLVESSVSVTSLSNITAAGVGNYTSVPIASANSNTDLPLTGLNAGTYKLYTVDVAGNISLAATNLVTVNNPPVNTVPATFSLNEDTPTVITGLSVTDPDAGASLTVTLSVLHGTLQVPGNITNGVTSVSNNGTASVTLSGTVAQINATLADAIGVTYTPAANYNGSDTFTLLSDDGIMTDSDQMVLTVTAVNDAPTLTAVNTLTGFTEGSFHSISYATLAAAANESDVDGGNLSFRIESVSSGTLQKWDGAAWANVTAGTLVGSTDTLQWKSATGASGSGLNAFTVVAWDGSLASSTPIQVQADVVSSVVAGEPIIDLGANGKLILPVQVDGHWYYYWDRSGNGSTTGTDSTTHNVLDGLFNKDINGVVNSTDLNTDGSYGTTDTYRYNTSLSTFKLALPTAGGGLDGSGNAIVRDYSWFPTSIGYQQTGDTSINTAYNDLLAIWDAYNGSETEADVTYNQGPSLAGVMPVGWFSASAAYWSASSTSNGHATTTLDWGNVANAVDTSSFNVLIQVLDNVAPVFSSSSALTISENKNPSDVIYNAEATDNQSGGVVDKFVSYSLSGVDTVNFSINTTTGEVRFIKNLDFETPLDSDGDNVYDINVIATDPDHNATSQAVAITVTNQSDSPGTSVIDLGTYGKLIAPVQVEGKWYYYWDRSGDGTTADSGSLNNGRDWAVSDDLDPIFNHDINGVTNTTVANADGSYGTTDTYRYATIGGVKVALPTVGIANPVDETKSGTSVSSPAETNYTYDDLLAIWDAFNGSTTGIDTTGKPSTWGSITGYLSSSASPFSSPSPNAHFHVSITGHVDELNDTNTGAWVVLQVLP